MSLTIYNLLHLSTIDVTFHLVKLLMFYNVQTTILTFVGRIRDIELIDIALRNFILQVMLINIFSVALEMKNFSNKCNNNNA